MPAESDESPRRSSAVSHGSSNLTASTAFALEAVEAEHQGLWWYKMAAKALLIFPYPAHEQEFEESWSEPAVLVQPMVVYSLLWYSDFVQHKSVDSASFNKGQLTCGAFSLGVPVLIAIACYCRRTSDWVRSHYHMILAGNVVVVMIFNVSVGIWDQLSLTSDFLCPQKFYACPHHAMDSQTISVTWISIVYINIFSSCLVKYKAAINAVIIFTFIIGVIAGGANVTVSGMNILAVHIVFNTIVIAIGTFAVGFQWELLFRQSLKTCATLKAGSETISMVLSKVLPERLLNNPFKVPLLEEFDGVTVLFCSFKKDAISHFEEGHFFEQVNDIYSRFDDIVERSGCFKVEHVGEDYVVVSGNVCDGVTEQENLEMHRESAILMARLALELVEAGSSFISWGQRTGQKFGFRAGLHFGKLSAGILGRSRRFYRIFGDTVVTSARMCQHTDPGTVQISDSMNELMGDAQPDRLPGRPVETKGKGLLNAFVLETPGKHVWSRRVADQTVDRHNRSQGEESFSFLMRPSPSMLSRPGSMGGGAGGCFAFSRTTRIGGILKLPIFESSASNHTLTRQESGGQSALPPARQSMSEHLRGPAQNIFGMEFCRRIYQESFDEIAKRDAPKPRRRKSSLQHMKEQNVRMHRATSIRPGDISFHSKAKFHDNSEGIGEEDAVQQKVYGLVGQFLDPELEDDFREDCPADLASRCLHFLFSSRTMGFVLFSSVSSLGQTSGWTTPPGLTGAVAGKKMNFDDVIITSWLWVALAILFFASLLLPPFVMTLHKWWGPQLAFATQSFIFGLATLTTMICTPSVLSLGVPLSFIAQIAAATMDVAIAIALSAPIVVLCFVEAYNSGKLVSNSAVGFYATILAGSLIVVLAHSTWNEMEIRSIWRSQRSLSHEKKVYETILHDMLPTQYVRRIVRSVAVVGTKLKAIVLFSDLKGYSKLNEQMSAYEIAMVMHGLWCVFDALVQKHGMHKMDTVGDAFIVIGLVDEDDKNLAQKASSMVDLAREMVVALEDVSRAVSSGQKWWNYVDGTIKFDTALISNDQNCFNREDAGILQIRIGIDAGEVVAGVIGKLQPRFHAHGAVMASAQKLEAACLQGTVLISQEIARILQMHVNKQNEVAGFQIPFPILEYFFPPDTSTEEFRAKANSKDKSFLQLVLELTGFAVALHPEIKLKPKNWDDEERAQKKAKALELLQGLRVFSQNKSDWLAGSKTRSKVIRLHVDIPEPDQELREEARGKSFVLDAFRSMLHLDGLAEEDPSASNWASQMTCEQSSDGEVAIPKRATGDDCNLCPNLPLQPGNLDRPSSDHEVELCVEGSEGEENVGKRDGENERNGIHAAVAAEIQDLHATFSAIVVDQQIEADGPGDTAVVADHTADKEFVSVSASFVHPDGLDAEHQNVPLPGGSC